MHYIRKPDDCFNNIQDPLVREYYELCKKLKLSIDERCIGFTRATYYRWVKNKKVPNEHHRQILQGFINANK